MTHSSSSCGIMTDFPLRTICEAPSRVHATRICTTIATRETSVEARAPFSSSWSFPLLLSRNRNELIIANIGDSSAYVCCDVPSLFYQRAIGTWEADSRHVQSPREQCGREAACVGFGSAHQGRASLRTACVVAIVRRLSVQFLFVSGAFHLHTQAEWGASSLCHSGIRWRVGLCSCFGGLRPSYRVKKRVTS